MGYEITRNLISVRKSEKSSKSAMISDTSLHLWSQIPDYEEVDCDGLTIKLPKDKSLYSDSDSPNILYDLLVHGGTDNIRYYDRDFHHDMKIISEMNPDILFAIYVFCVEYLHFCNEYYLNGKMIKDYGHLAYKYNDLDEILSANADEWSDIKD